MVEGGNMKKRKTGIKQRVNGACNFHGCGGQFCKQGDIRTQTSSKRWRQIKDYGVSVFPAEGMASAKAPRIVFLQYSSQRRKVHAASGMNKKD